MGQSRKRNYYRSIFDAVLSRYNEVKSVGADGANMGVSNGVVQPSQSDFLCDVELSIRGSLLDELKLTPNLQRVFLDLYIGQPAPSESLSKLLSSPKFQVVKNKVESRLGRDFLERELYPLFRYQAPVDVR